MTSSADVPEAASQPRRTPPWTAQGVAAAVHAAQRAPSRRANERRSASGDGRERAVMKKRGYEQSVQRESADSSVYDDEEDGGMLATSRNPAVRAKAYEGKQPHPTRWVCGTIICTLFVVFLAIWVGSGTSTGREVLSRMAQGNDDGADYVACVKLRVGRTAVAACSQTQNLTAHLLICTLGTMLSLWTARLTPAQWPKISAATYVI